MKRACPLLLPLVAWWLAFTTLAPALAGSPPRLAEDEKIEALLAYVSSQPDLKFIRNGSEYGCSTAAKFLRGKWDRQKEQIQTARDFIAKAATKSSTTGLAYRIRSPDGRETDCALFLSEKLKELEAKPASS